MKAPKISAPQAAPAVAQEPPVRVEKIEDQNVSDYNARSRRRKGILSTILAGKDSQNSSSSSGLSTSDTSSSALRKTLG